MTAIRHRRRHTGRGTHPGPFSFRRRHNGRLQSHTKSPARFREELLTDCDGRLLPVADVSDTWQSADFDALDPAWQRVAGFGDRDATPVQRGWLERPRGHSKTTDLAVMSLYALFASKRMLRGYAAAADRDQAKLLKDAIEKLLRDNPWLNPDLAGDKRQGRDKLFAVQQNRVVNTKTGSTLNFMSADAATSYGILPDFVILDEVSHWSDRKLWDSLTSSAAKKARCVVVVITNAGWRDSWVWEQREQIRESESWYFSRLDGPQASWIGFDRIEEQKTTLPEQQFRRLWLNEWTEGIGDAISPDVIRRAVVHSGPVYVPVRGYRLVAGLDLGVKRDASAFVVAGVHVGHVETRTRLPDLPPAMRSAVEAGLIPCEEVDEQIVHEGTGKVRVLQCHAWTPTKGREVDLSAVENTVRDTCRRLGILHVGYDPHQAQHMAQRLRRDRVPMVEIAFSSGGNMQRMASETLESFGENRVELYDDADLIRDLERLRIIERPSGFRLDTKRDKDGHGDRGTAFVLALLMARKVRNKLRNLVADSLMLQPREDGPVPIPASSYAGFERKDFREADVFH